jgi:hypothetical protein
MANYLISDLVRRQSLVIKGFVKNLIVDAE